MRKVFSMALAGMGGRLAAAFLLCVLGLGAQTPRSNAGAGRTYLSVPMVGRGTWEDPKRPALVREAGVGFRFELSDDGTMAIVEASPRNLAELAKLTELAAKEPRAKMFHPGKDNVSSVLTEFKRLKKDFDPEAFGKPGFAVKPPLPEAAK